MDEDLCYYNHYSTHYHPQHPRLIQERPPPSTGPSASTALHSAFTPTMYQGHHDQEDSWFSNLKTPFTQDYSQEQAPLSPIQTADDDDDLEEDHVPQAPLDSPFCDFLSSLPPTEIRSRARSNSVPSLCYSLSTVSSPSTTCSDLSPYEEPIAIDDEQRSNASESDQEDEDDDEFDFADSPPKDEEEYHPYGGLGLGFEDHYPEISLYPPSFTPPTFYFSPFPTEASTPENSTMLTQPDELTNLLHLQRRTKEDLARLDESVQLHSSPTFSTPATLSVLKARRKAAKDRCKEVDGLIRFGLEHRSPYQYGWEAPPLPARISPPSLTTSALNLLPSHPTSGPALPPPLCIAPAHDNFHGTTAAGPGSLLFPTLPSPINLASKKKKKEPPCSVHHLLSRMIMGRRDKSAVKAIRSSCGLDACEGAAGRRKSLLGNVWKPEEVESETAESESGDAPIVEETDAQMEESEEQDEVAEDDDDLDQLGLTGFS